MRKVTSDIVHAFLDRKPRTVQNSTTDGDSLLLHGHVIAWHGQYRGATGVFLTLAGWGTATTRERLNGVLEVMGHNRNPYLYFFQEKHEQWIGGNSIAGETTKEDWRWRRGLDTSGVIFVCHPCVAKGQDAVTIFPDSVTPAAIRTNSPEVVDRLAVTS